MPSLTDAQLRELIAGGESERVEFKASFSDKARIAETVCALANDLGDSRLSGYVLIGVGDTGLPTGLNVDDELLRELAALRLDGHILPLPDMRIERRIVDGKAIAVIEVPPSQDPPVRYRNRILVRTGPTTTRGTRDQERVLTEKRRHNNAPYDHKPAYDATLDDLDLTLFERVYLPAAVAPEVLAENDRTVEQKLSSLRLLCEGGTPSIGGILALGRDPCRYVPGAYIQFVRFDGTEVSSPIRNHSRITGPLPDQLKEVDLVLRANVSIAMDIRSASTEINTPDYPLTALQQFVRNAVMHRNYESSNSPIHLYWYTDRVEIDSAGGPYGRITLANFGEPGLTDYRNPLVAEAMRVFGFVQRFGVGLGQASAALRDNGNPPYQYDGSSQSTRIIVRKRPE
jgi:ATP-dependent DNA helicase RecG